MCIFFGMCFRLFFYLKVNLTFCTKDEAPVVFELSFVTTWFHTLRASVTVPMFSGWLQWLLLQQWPWWWPAESDINDTSATFKAAKLRVIFQSFIFCTVVKQVDGPHRSQENSIFSIVSIVRSTKRLPGTKNNASYPQSGAHEIRVKGKQVELGLKMNVSEGKMW